MAEQIFNEFTVDAHGTPTKQMDGRQFSKMAKVATIKTADETWSLLDKKFTMTDIDIIFSKVKSKGERKITKKQFSDALGLIADKNKISYDELIEKIMKSGGQKFTGTKAEHVELYDDKAGYTGVSAKGGPSTLDEMNVADLSLFTDRTPLGPSHPKAKSPATHKKPPPAAEVVYAHVPAASLQEVFSTFTHGDKEMDGKTLSKFAKDSKLLTKKVTSTDVDINFAKFKSKGSRKITFSQFEQVVESFATKEKISVEEMVEQILVQGGPTFSGTKVQATRLHDDKSTYTGVYTKGGPSTIGRGYRDEGQIDDLSQQLDRKHANIRGTKD